MLISQHLKENSMETYHLQNIAMDLDRLLYAFVKLPAEEQEKAYAMFCYLVSYLLNIKQLLLRFRGSKYL